VVTRGRILVVEDDEDLRTMLAELLSEHGFDVDQARNGRDALDHLQNGTPAPAAILLDHIMPVMDAMEFLEERARRPPLVGIPTLLLTALDPTKLTWPDGVEPPSVHGKPIDIDRLLAALDDICA
jgi:CheY-like chemotaxis protein